ncbi:MAG TPA: ABC transporter permease, partial [Pirellulales bacterium]|nr:ABC transporter permease [Pirellulales bacterium]
MVSEPLHIGLLLAAMALGALLLLGRVPLRYNVRNLVVRWRTTLLTSLAFTLVVGLLIVMLAFVRGMNELTEHSGHPENVIVLSDGAMDELVSNLGYGDSSDLERQPEVVRDEQGR